jgi:hypothetical protein
VSDADATPGPDATPDRSGAAAEDKDRNPTEHALDMFVYAPAGLILTALEDLPALTAKGRARISQQVRNAHAVGRMAVALGQQDLQRRIARARRPGGATTTAEEEPSGREPSAPGPPGPPLPAPSAPSPDPLAAPPRGTESGGVARPTASDLLGRSGPPIDAAIPGYDTLSASQVVRRLDGLGPVELESVLRYETATRDRRTIVHRVQQLLGVEDPPGSSPSEPAAD